MSIGVIDESRLDAGSPEQAPTELDGLADLIAELKGGGTNVYKRHNVWEAHVAPGLSLMDVLFNEVSILDNDKRLWLMEQVAGLVDWDSLGDTTASAAYAQQLLQAGQVVACVVIPKQDGFVQVGTKFLHLIGTTERLIRFYRDAPELGGYSEGEFMRNATRAFPALYFHKDLEAQISKFSVAFAGMRASLIEALADLNDKLPVALRQSPDLRTAAKIFEAQSKFEISPESPKTHKNRTAMICRDVSFEGTTLRCEWHLKLQPHIDRIHFYFGKQEVASDKILIGIFCDHLPT